MALTAFYTEFNPEKLDQVDYILGKYEGDYHALFTRLRYKYASEHAASEQTPGKAAGGGNGGNGGPQGDNKLAQGWSNLMGGLGDKMRDAQDKVREARVKLQESGKLDEIGDKLKENAGKLCPTSELCMLGEEVVGMNLFLGEF